MKTFNQQRAFENFAKLCELCLEKGKSLPMATSVYGSCIFPVSLGDAPVDCDRLMDDMGAFGKAAAISAVLCNSRRGFTSQGAAQRSSQSCRAVFDHVSGVSGIGMRWNFVRLYTGFVDADLEGYTPVQWVGIVESIFNAIRDQWAEADRMFANPNNLKVFAYKVLLTMEQVAACLIGNYRGEPIEGVQFATSSDDLLVGLALQATCAWTGNFVASVLKYVDNYYQPLISKLAPESKEYNTERGNWLGCRSRLEVITSELKEWDILLNLVRMATKGETVNELSAEGDEFKVSSRAYDANEPTIVQGCIELTEAK